MPKSDDIRGFFEAERPEYTSVGGILYDIVQRCGKEIFLDKEALEAEMRQAKIPEQRILQIKLMVSAAGFQELIRAEEGETEETNLNRFIGNAQEETGLGRETVLAVGADISAALGYPVVTEQRLYEKAQKNGRGFVVPFALYEKEMKPIREHFRKHEDLSAEEMKALTRLTEAGLPEAQMYMSEYLKDKNPETAQELLLQAAEQGNGEAQAKLGDLYYSEARGTSWEEAYHCYTGYGTAALNRNRRINLKNILNQRIYNIRVLRLGLLVLGAMLFLTIFQTLGSLYGIHPAWSVLFLLAGAGIWGAAAVRYKAHPFAFFNWLIPAMSGLLGIYLLIWLL